MAGRRAHPGPPLPEASGGEGRFAREVEGCLDATAAGIERFTRGGAGDPATLHRLHRDLRRLRVGLAIWGRLAGKRTQRELARHDRWARGLAQRVGETRDFDVVLGLLGRRDPRRGGREDDLLYALQDEIRRRGRAARETLRAELGTAEPVERIERLRATLRSPRQRPRDDRVARFLGELEAERGSDVRRAHRRARRRPSTRRLHRLRIHFRNWRHLADFSAVVAPGEPRSPPEEIRHLQRGLGYLHDLDVASEMAGPAVRTRWGRRLRRERARSRRRIVRTLRDLRPRELVALAGAPA